MRLSSSLILSSLAAVITAQISMTPTVSNNRTISIPEEATYILPPQFMGNISANFIDTNTSNSALNTIFAQARSSLFISYYFRVQHLTGTEPTGQIGS